MNTSLKTVLRKTAFIGFTALVCLILTGKGQASQGIGAHRQNANQERGKNQQQDFSQNQQKNNRPKQKISRTTRLKSKVVGGKAAVKHFAKTSVKQIGKGVGWTAAVNPITGPVVGAGMGGMGGLMAGLMANDSGEMSDGKAAAVAVGLGVAGVAGGAAVGTAAGLANPIVQPAYRGYRIVKDGVGGGIKKGRQAAKDYRDQKRQQQYTQE